MLELSGRFAFDADCDAVVRFILGKTTDGYRTIEVASPGFRLIGYLDGFLPRPNALYACDMTVSVTQASEDWRTAYEDEYSRLNAAYESALSGLAFDFVPAERWLIWLMNAAEIAITQERRGESMASLYIETDPECWPEREDIDCMRVGTRLISTFWHDLILGWLNRHDISADAVAGADVAETGQPAQGEAQTGGAMKQTVDLTLLWELPELAVSFDDLTQAIGYHLSTATVLRHDLDAGPLWSDSVPETVQQMVDFDPNRDCVVLPDGRVAFKLCRYPLGDLGEIWVRKTGEKRTQVTITPVPYPTERDTLKYALEALGVEIYPGDREPLSVIEGLIRGEVRDFLGLPPPPPGRLVAEEYRSFLEEMDGWLVVEWVLHVFGNIDIGDLPPFVQTKVVVSEVAAAATGETEVAIPPLVRRLAAEQVKEPAEEEARDRVRAAVQKFDEMTDRLVGEREQEQMRVIEVLLHRLGQDGLLVLAPGCSELDREIIERYLHEDGLLQYARQPGAATPPAGQATQALPAEGITDGQATPPKSSPQPIRLQLGQPGRKRDPEYDKAAEAIRAGTPYDVAFEQFCKGTKTTRPDKGTRDAFKAAMKRRGVIKAGDEIATK